MSNNIKLKNKKILFFTPNFFNYENKIKEKMEELGAKVDMYNERSIDSSFEKALLKIDPYIFKNKTEKYYLSILNSVKNNNYDFVFFIKAEMVTEKILTLYKEAFKNAKFVLYLWDSFKNIKHIENKIKYFDVVKSFDRFDAQKYNLGFRPLFYCDDYQKEEINNEYKYDLCFIGTIHSDRYKILKQIKQYSDDNKISFYYYPFLQSKFIYYFYKLTKKEFRKTRITDFRFDKIAAKDIAKKIAESKVIIDIQHPKQTGLTMRTIEMIGMNKKLITTNAEIREYDFYNENNIQVLDRDNPIINSIIFDNDYKKINKKIYEKYSIESWIYEVLSIE